MRQTAVALSFVASNAFLTQRPMFRPYGGFMNTVSLDQDCANPSSSIVKYRLHLAFP